MSDDASCCTREIHICVQTNEVPSLGNQIFQSDRSTYSLRYWTPHERCIKRRCSSIVVIVSKLHSQELIGQAGSRLVFNRIQYVITLIRVHQEIITWLDSMMTRWPPFISNFWLGVWPDNKSSFRSFYVLIYCLKERVSIFCKANVRNHWRVASSPSAKF